MTFTKFTNLDFDQIRESIKDYLRANSDFSGFDFDGSNFSILIDTLAYNTYITAFNSNMIVNESFLDSATVRENVVSLARNIGYLPRSRTAARAIVSFTVDVEDTQTATINLKRGLCFVGNVSNTSEVFSILENVQRTTENIDFEQNLNTISARRSVFNNIEIIQGTFLTKTFTFDGSLDQRFILDNPFIDTSTIKVYIKKENETSDGIEYFQSNTLKDINKESLVYFLQEIQDEKYEILFGDGLIGRKLQEGEIITVNYLVTNGKDGNDVSIFGFSGVFTDDLGNVLIPNSFSVTTNTKSQNGGEIESITSIKNYAPSIYAAQNRAVTSRDYESIIKTIYSDTESVSVIGGEELDPPQFGVVEISIKPKNGFFVSDFNKSLILSDLKKYSISGINQKIIDLKILYIELDTFVYYDDSKISSADSLKTKVSNSLTNYSEKSDVNKFGGRFKYSKILKTIDDTESSITSNITKVVIRRNLVALLNQQVQYELCFGNQFHVKSEGRNIKSTGFTIAEESGVVYFTDTPNADGKTGILSVVKNSNDENITIITKAVGTVDYVKGEVNIGTINITSTVKPNNVIEIQAFPESNDIVGLRDLYLNFDVSKSKINMVKDVISSGDEISGTVFVRDFYTSSYSNGTLIRE